MVEADERDVFKLDAITADLPEGMGPFSERDILVLLQQKSGPP